MNRPSDEGAGGLSLPADGRLRRATGSPAGGGLRCLARWVSGLSGLKSAASRCRAARSLMALLCVLATAIPCAVPGEAARLGADAGLVAIAGVVPPSVRAGLAIPVGYLASSMPMSVALGLVSRDPMGLDAAVRAVSSPGDPLYRHYLAAATIEARFGPDAAAVHALAAWLASVGLRPRPWSGGSILDVDGTAAQFSAAFHIGLRSYALAAPPSGTHVLPAGRSPAAGMAVPAYAPDRDPLVPRRFAGLISAVVGLQAVQATASAHVGVPMRAHADSGPNGGYDPGQIAQAYDFVSLYNSGYHGEHTRVALVELAPYDQTDITQYAAWAGVGAGVNNIPVDGGAAKSPANVEATLDIELLSSTAPGTTIDVYEAPYDNTDKSLLDAYGRVVSAHNAQVLAIAWNTCEQAAEMIPGLVSAEHVLFMQLTLQGTTVVSSTGDSGAYACSNMKQYAHTPSVDLPASDPYALAVGATDLVLLGGGQRPYAIANETAWSCKTCKGHYPRGTGSGGGVSALFHTGDVYRDDLAWQSIPAAVRGKAGSARLVPDVSIAGSTSTAHEYAIYWKHAWTVGGGTSASAMVWAGLILLVDQYLGAHNAPSAGWINPIVYRLGSQLQLYAPFHDVYAGDNLLYGAGPGWDLATGWGSPDAWSFTLDVACAMGLGTGCSPAPPATATASASPTRSATPVHRAPATATARPTRKPTSIPARTPTAHRAATATRTPTRRPATATRTPTGHAK